jgi:2,4-dienoyl-CoA reductase-like NADH-dependent reductase (Old Yellow Enzyme family)
MSNSRLFEPLKVGAMTLQHRLVMAPLTRFRADKDHVQLPFVKEYYAQRASVPGTLIITEATFISRQAGGYPSVPGLWSKEQIAAWKEVTDAVHAKGSFIVVQLWAEGFEVTGASPIPADSDSATPRELTVDDIKSFISDYAQAARNAVEAGFDGVELHGANGYLVDQFIQDVSNQRTDSYGGSIENRSRFAIEAATAIVEAIGADKVGIRLSPYSTFQGMRMEDPVPQFTHVIKELKKLKLAYLHLVEARISGNADIESTDKVKFAVDVWDKTSPVFLAGGFSAESAKKAVDEDYKGVEAAVVFGRYFISTPDLPYRIKKGLPLAQYNRDTFYNAGSREGYTDYPFSEEWNKEIAVKA